MGNNLPKSHSQDPQTPRIDLFPRHDKKNRRLQSFTVKWSGAQFGGQYELELRWPGVLEGELGQETTVLFRSLTPPVWPQADDRLSPSPDAFPHLLGQGGRVQVSSEGPLKEL